jgi:hypothetical protein
VRLPPILAVVALLACERAKPPQAPPAVPSAPVPDGTRLAYKGKTQFLAGANVPWNRWACDFGCGAEGGVSGSRGELAERFAEARKSGLSLFRWWVFEDDARPIRRDRFDAPTELDPAVYTDLDAALELAKTLDLTYVLVLFSGPSRLPRSWLENADHRKRLGEVLAPLFSRYDATGRIMTWEIFNEPEWDIWRKKVPAEPVQQLVTELVRVVHASCSSYATVGSATLEALPMWKSAGFDYYDAHWYDPMRGDACAICTDYETVRTHYGLDRPLILGEIYAGPNTDALGRLEKLYSKHYAGAWGWSLLSFRTHDRMSIDLDAARAFRARHDDVGP